MQEEFLDQSILLGKLMQDRFTGKLNRKDRKVKQAGFIVLHQTFMPSVLIETGFLTNRDEGQYLNSKKGQEEMGRAIAEAILEYRSTIPSNNSVIAPNVGENIPEETPLKSQEVIKEAGDVKKEAEAEIAAQNAAGVANNDKTREAVVDPQPPKEKAVNPENRVQEKLEETGAEAEVKSSTDLNKSEDLKAVAKAETPDSGLPGPAVKTGAAIEVGTQVAKEDSAETPAKNVGRSEAANKTPAAETRNKTNPSVTEKAGVTFKVQLMAVSNDIPLTPSNFKGLNTLSKEPINSMYRILYGNTSSYEQAKVLQAGARQKGYDQAYIVAYKDGQRIAVDKALTYLSN
jgi:N-acetylmuramoyl-L-alanine amidase